MKGTSLTNGIRRKSEIRAPKTHKTVVLLKTHGFSIQTNLAMNPNCLVVISVTQTLSPKFLSLKYSVIFYVIRKVVRNARNPHMLTIKLNS